MKRNSRILIIDDKPWWSGFSKKVLLEHGYRVDMARNREEALNKLDSQRYDMVILDYYFSGTDGVSSLRQILKRHPEERVVVVSAAPSWMEGRDIFRAGAIDYMSKSLDETRLLDIIQKVLKMKPSPVISRKR